MERCCLDCKAELRGRTDKKFCDDQCRSNYHNTLHAREDTFVKQVNQILKKNRNILLLENPTGKKKVKRELLLQKGFNFNYFTHSSTTRKGKAYCFCYEYGYQILGEKEVLLLKAPKVKEKVKCEI